MPTKTSPSPDELSKSPPAILGLAAYHTQQAAEKSVKGLLRLTGAPAGAVSRIPFTHNISVLLPLIPTGNPSHALATAVDATSPWASGFRYGSAGVPTPKPRAGEITAMLATIEALQATIAGQIPSLIGATARDLLRLCPTSPRHRDRIYVAVTQALLDDALQPTPTKPVGAALATLFPSMLQVGREYVDGELMEDGMTYLGRDAARHLLVRLSAAPSSTTATFATFKASVADAITITRPDLVTEYAGLVDATRNQLSRRGRTRPLASRER